MSNRLLLVLLAVAGAFVIVALLVVARDDAPREARRTTAPAGATPEPDSSPTVSDTPVSAGEAEAPTEVVASPDPDEAVRKEAATAYEAELAEGHWVEGRLVFPAGTPVDEEAYVIAKGRKLASGDYHRVRVEHNGEFRVGFSEKTRKGWLRIAARYVYLEESVRIAVREAEHQTLTPLLGGRLHGRLVLPENCPVSAAEIAGGTVSLRGRPGNGGQELMREYELTEELTYAFGGLPTTHLYRIEFESERIQPARLDGLSVDAGQSTEIDLEAGLGVTIAGRVLNETGAPLPDVDVQTRVELSSGWAGGTWRNTKSAADGTFRIHGSAPGQVKVIANLKGFEEAEHELDELADGEAAEGIELVLTRGRAIAGRVVWPDGSPAAGASLFARKSADRQVFYGDPSATWKTDAEGRFHITGLEDETYTVIAHDTKSEKVVVVSEVTGKERTRNKKVRWRARKSGIAPGGEELTLELGRGLVLTGRVVDDQGAGLERFSVRARRGGTRGFWNMNTAEALSATFKDAGGVFELEGFDEGSWVVQAIARDHGDSEEIALTVPDDLTEKVLVCPREATVLGVVRTPAGAPVPDARVSVEYRNPMVFDPLGNKSVQTNESGAFEVTVKPGPVGLTAQGRDLAQTDTLWIDVAPAETRSGIELTLRAGGALAIELTGEHIARRQVRVINWQSDYRKSFLTDAAGRIEVDNLPPGQFQITADATDDEVRDAVGATTLRSAFDILRRTETIDLPRGESARVVLHLPRVDPMRLTGRVLAGEQPVPEVHLWARLGEARSTSSGQTDGEGRYELVLPGPGEYAVGINDWESGLNYETSVMVPDVASHAFDIAFPVGTVSGRVLGPRGKPLEGVRVFAKPKGLESGWAMSGTTVTDHEGKYELESVVAGTYTILAGGAQRYYYQESGGQYGEARVADVLVAANGRVTGIDLRLSEAGTLAGRVRDGDGAPVQALILLRDSEGRSVGLGAARSEISGRFEIKGLTPGTVRVTAQTPTSLSKTVEAVISPKGVAELELELEPAGQVVVRVAGGNDSSEILVRLRGEDGADHAAQKHVEEVARWSFGPLAPGSYSVTATDGLRSAEGSVTVTAGTPAEVELALE